MYHHCTSACITTSLYIFGECFLYLCKNILLTQAKKERKERQLESSTHNHSAITPDKSPSFHSFPCTASGRCQSANLTPADHLESAEYSYITITRQLRISISFLYLFVSFFLQNSTLLKEDSVFASFFQSPANKSVIMTAIGTHQEWIYKGEGVGLMA